MREIRRENKWPIPLMDRRYVVTSAEGIDEALKLDVKNLNGYLNEVGGTFLFGEGVMKDLSRYCESLN